MTLVVACSSVSEDTTRADALEIIGCSAHPSCDDTFMGRYCLPACTPECTSRHMATGLWVSPYEVAGTLGLGRHQGLALVSLSVDFDPRFSETDGVNGSAGHLPADVISAMVQGPGHAHGALCGAPDIVLDRALGNHGRPLSRAPNHAAHRKAMVLSAVDAPIAVANDAKSTAPLGGAWTARLTSCLARITDGYCDSVCGNCSYVLPAESVVDGLAGDYSSPDDVIVGSYACEPAYYGGPGKTSEPSMRGQRMSNNFTHCARLGCGQRDEAPSLAAIADGAAPMSGRFGHNSNSDAEAELRAVNECLAGRDPRPIACAACGEGWTGLQNPCTSHTNTARSTWSRAQPTWAMIPADEIEPITETTGGATPKPTIPPSCAWGPFRVYGM